MRGVNFCLGCSSRRDVFYRREEADGARDRRDRATSARFAFEDAARIVEGGRDVSGCDRYCKNGRRGAKKCVCVPRAARPRERRFESDAPRDGHGEHATHHMDGCDVRTLRMAQTEPSGSCSDAQLTSVCASDDIMFFSMTERTGLRFGHRRDTGGSARSRETCRTLWSPLRDGVGQI